MGDNLKQKTVNALKWSTVDRFGQQGVQFFIGIILARLLSPEDFGLLGIIMILPLCLLCWLKAVLVRRL